MLIILDIAIPQVRESETILDSELPAVDSGFQFLSEGLGFWIPIVSGIPESKAQEFGFHKQIFSDSEFHKQNILDSRIQIPLHRAIIKIMMMFRVVQDVDLNYQHLARLIVHGCCSGVTPFNPLSPNSDKDQFSPDNIHTLSRDKL